MVTICITGHITAEANKSIKNVGIPRILRALIALNNYEKSFICMSLNGIELLENIAIFVRPFALYVSEHCYICPFKSSTTKPLLNTQII